MSVYQVYTTPKKKRFEGISVTTKLIFVNVLAFVIFWALMVLNILPLDYIALNPESILYKFYFWTFLSSMFMHGGIFHLFVNMVSLFFVGSLIERILGKKRYFWFYIVSGLFAGVLFVLSPFVFPSDWGTYAVGASGALFGLVGLLMVLTPNLKVYMMFIPIPIKMKYAAPGMLIVLWIISVAGSVPIGNVAHFGGLIAGLIYGFILRNKFPNKVKYIGRHFS